jgi:hypothetical protein
MYSSIADLIPKLNGSKSLIAGTVIIPATTNRPNTIERFLFIKDRNIK